MSSHTVSSGTMPSSKQTTDEGTDRSAKEQSTEKPDDGQSTHARLESYHKKIQEWLCTAEREKEEEKVARLGLAQQVKVGLDTMGKSISDLREVGVQISIAAAVQSPTFLPEAEDDRVVSLAADLRRDMAQLSQQLRDVQRLFERFRIATALIENATPDKV